MSTILKGIDLPRNGDCHHITIYDNGNTYITTSNVLYETDRKDVEAIQIPKGHGAIKDINTFLKDKYLTEYIENDVFNKKYTYTINTGAIYNAPTILEAEE